MSHKKKKLLKKSVPKNPTTHTFFSKLQKNPNYFFLSQSNHWEANDPSLSENSNFWSICFLILRAMCIWTGSIRFPALLTDFKPFPAVASLFQPCPAFSTHVWPFQTISNHYQQLKPFSTVSTNFHPFPFLFNHMQTFSAISSHHLLLQSFPNSNISLFDSLPIPRARLYNYTSLISNYNQN